MTKEEYAKSLDVINSEKRIINKRHKALLRDYIESTSKFKRGDDVIVNTSTYKDTHGWVACIKISKHGEFKYSVSFESNEENLEYLSVRECRDAWLKAEDMELRNNDENN